VPLVIAVSFPLRIAVGAQTPYSTPPLPGIVAAAWAHGADARLGTAAVCTPSPR